MVLFCRLKNTFRAYLHIHTLSTTAMNKVHGWLGDR